MLHEQYGKMEDKSVILAIVIWKGLKESGINTSDRRKTRRGKTEATRVAKQTFQSQNKECIFLRSSNGESL